MPKQSTKTDVIADLQLRAAFAQARQLAKDGRVAEAAVLCQRVLRADTRHSGALHLMGKLALRTGATEIAVGSLQRASVQAPRSAAILRDLGDALNAGGRYPEAISAYRKALTLAPKDAAAFVALADAQLDSGNAADALRSYRKALSLDRTHSRAAHMVAALSGDQSDPLAAGYVPALFDQYAEIFDTHLAQTLDYHVPERLREAVGRYLPATGRFATALDLGCGTGLVATALADVVDAIDGVDIARKMIEIAGAKGHYRALAAGDLVEMMVQRPYFSGPYELVTAADVFIYVGALEAVFAAVKKVLRPGGLFAFSIEDAGGAGVAIRSSGRFAHGRAYITGLGADCGFAILEDSQIPIRQEHHVPISGRLFVLRGS